MTTFRIAPHPQPEREAVEVIAADGVLLAVLYVSADETRLRVVSKYLGVVVVDHGTPQVAEGTLVRS